MTFGQPDFLYLFILIPLLALLMWGTARRKQTMLQRLGNPALIARLSHSVNRQGRRWQTALWFLAVTLLILSLARPQWGSEIQAIEQEGIEIIVALDVSESMLAEDIKPNRLSRAKLEISDLMAHLTGDELGLVLFSGTSFIQFPLTSDFATARNFLDEAGPEDISQPGTNLESALKTALSGFNQERASQKVVIIMTDGENHNGNPVSLAREAAAQGILVYTIGFGSSRGEPIPQYNNQGEIIGYKKDANNNTVLSKLDEITLQEIALATGGRYYRAGAGGQELNALTAELDTLQKATLESRFETLHIERFQGFLIGALLALLTVEIIPDRKPGR